MSWLLAISLITRFGHLPDAMTDWYEGKMPWMRIPANFTGDAGLNKNLIETFMLNHITRAVVTVISKVQDSYGMF